MWIQGLWLWVILFLGNFKVSTTRVTAILGLNCRRLRRARHARLSTLVADTLKFPKNKITQNHKHYKCEVGEKLYER